MTASKKLVCPSCGWDGSTDGQHHGWFRYVEQLTNEHLIEGINPRGVLQLADGPTVLVHPASQHIWCGNCLAEFPVPDGVKVELP